MSGLKKTLLITAIAITTLVAVGIAFASPIAKYLVEKYDLKYTGREITMDYAYVNPFTGYVYLNNLTIQELQSDSVFLSVESVSANFSLYKLFSKTYEISELELNKPTGNVTQNGNKHVLNFDDLIEKFTPKKKGASSKPVHFSILHITIKEGEFHYLENLIPIHYFIKKVNIESSGIHWDADTIALKFSLIQGEGSGDIKGRFTINSKNRDYRFAAVVHKFDLNIIQQYLKDLSNYGSFSANMDADINANGNFNNKEDVTSKGILAFHDFHFGKNPTDDYASFDKLVVVMKDVSPKKLIYSFDSVALSHPYLKYERYDSLDNLQTMFGKGGSKIKAADNNTKKFNLVIEIGNYIKDLSKNFFRSNYQIGRLAIYKGDIVFSDFSISEKFSMALNPFYLVADSVDKNRKRVVATVNSGLKPYGNTMVTLSINPKDSSDFDLRYRFQKIPIAMFNPYSISFTSFPFNRGTLELNGTWNVRNGNIQSDNRLLIIDPRLARRFKSKDVKWIPMPLLFFLTRERGNVMDYEIPITGNLKNPKFHFRDVLMDLLGNVFVKPVSTPYRYKVRHLETEIEKTLTLKWEMRQSSLSQDQERFVEKTARLLLESPEAVITISPHLFESKEKEYILFYEAKKKYFLHITNQKALAFSRSDSERVDKMSVKDPLFEQYLNKRTKGSLVFTIQEKCALLIDSSFINEKFRRLNKERMSVFLSYFKKDGVERRVKILRTETDIPYDGFSFYKIQYPGKFPEDLISAYIEMNELNNLAPRKKFKKNRLKALE